jgi:hypothetical protein
VPADGDADKNYRNAAAVQHYEAARASLEKLAAEYPGSTQYEFALAESHLRMARLAVNKDRQAATNDAARALAILQRLSSGSKDHRLLAAWLDAEIQAATLQGFVKGTDNLQKAQAISRDFEATPIPDAASLYQLACYLTSREPVLLSRQSAPEK